jgi:hypothetical protein
MELVAGVLILALAAAAVATIFATRNHSPQSAPAAALSVEAYQKMVRRDDGQLIVSRSGGCTTLQSICPAPGNPEQAALQRWLDDLNRSEPPARFTAIDGQLRRHLAAAISDLNAAYAAYQARDQNALDRANQSSREGLLDDAATAIADSQPGTLSGYIASIRAAFQDFGGCASCQSLVSQADCKALQTPSCQYSLVYAMRSINYFEIALVRISAPSSLAPQDTRLQNDLAQADTGILAMTTSFVTGDPAGFDAGRLMLRQALSAVNRDAGGMLGG